MQLCIFADKLRRMFRKGGNAPALLSPPRGKRKSPRAERACSEKFKAPPPRFAAFAFTKSTPFCILASAY